MTQQNLNDNSQNTPNGGIQQTQPSLNNATSAQNSQFSAQGHTETQLSNNNSTKSNKKLYIIIAIIVIALLGGVCYFVSSQKAANQEEMAYEVLENNDNPDDYRDFLEKYPNSAYADEVRQRLTKLEEMIDKWRSIAMSDNVNDFKDFKNTYSDVQYGRLCDIKIDSLDYITAQKLGTAEAYQQYLNAHPDGRYASEASIAQGSIHDQEVTDADRSQIANILTDFYNGFAAEDDDKICMNIAATMTTFLHQKNASKATVLNIIHGMFNEDIKGCQFNVNRDLQVKRKADTANGESFVATFTVDQHIQRDDEGKTYGQYRCVAEINSQMLITSLTMQEISKN